MSPPTSSHDDHLFQPSPDESKVPTGIDRRSFFMRNAVIGAAAVMTGKVHGLPEAACCPSVQRKQAQPSQGSKNLTRPGCRQEIQRPGDDRSG